VIKIINIEKISQKIFNLDTFSHIDETRRLKAQYGFSIVLGIIIEFFMASIISYFLGTFKYLWPMMIIGLIFKGSIKSQHCTSFSRCAIFTCIYFIGPSLIIKYLHDFHGYIISTIIMMVCMLNILILVIQKNIKGLKLIILLYIIMIFIYFINESFLIYMLSIDIGCLLRIFSCTEMGKIFVVFCDDLLTQIGIK
jgi:accessory gene regulator B